MAGGTRERLRSADAIKTYRYLRIGMVGAVVLLGAAIGWERWQVGRLGRACLQTSISAYYYTPVRAAFVGSLMVIGFALIMIKGRRSYEDICLNVAGMFAPVVAIVPTGDLGVFTTGTGASEATVPRCRPSTLLSEDGRIPADVIVSIVGNNFRALLIAGSLGLAVALVIALFVNRGVNNAMAAVGTGTTVSLLVTAGALALGWILISVWDSFPTQAHTPAAVLMFVALTLAVAGKATDHRRDANRTLFRLYTIVAVAMSAGGIAIQVFQLGRDHTTFLLEAWEIGLFAAFWVIQTAENWDEEVALAPA
ncbi:MAG: hypothetical protein ACR2HM_09650 [Acidimicrobiales bacterium]